ncbi:TetR family transcriptional regulator [Bacillus sp. AFS002410]|uniref:TetR/AcrR family transcriptional regulator n=1 Tax=Bacillus sp. AFS002410 TaxID=2033481 RepID=UPI000BEF96D5|nr:TetR/AcrR family transcriptional regulator [Bacillus sp. AFS002410]PEJ57258.1 TetR family transcriptional regulator [Bacillus sp. AFS002410]
MKQKIKEYSIQLFDQKGFKSTSIQDIVESIGVTKGTFYYYYTSKEQLLMDIHLHFIDEVLNEQEEVINDSEKSFSDKLFEVIYLSLLDIKKQGASAKVFYREMRHLSPESLTEIKAKRDLYRFNIEKLLNEGIKNGDLRSDFDVPIVSFAILGVMNWSYEWYNPEGTKKALEIAKTFQEMILKGINLK